MKKDNYKIFDTLIEGIQVIDKSWRYLYVNKSVVKQSTYSKKELIGFTMMEKYPGIEKTEMFKHLKNCMNKKTHHEMINEFNFPDGTKGYFELRMQSVPDGVLIMSFDVTQKKRLENEIKKLNENLEKLVLERTQELSKALEREIKLNELKSRFVSVASHEFKTPLGAIKISVNVLEKYNTPEYDEKRKVYYGHIKSSVSGMFHVLNDFLSIDRLEQGKVYTEKEKFNLKSFIKKEIEKLNYFCKDGQKISYSHKGKFNVFLDKQIIRSILTNLLSNAIKYSNDDIDIQTKINDSIHLIVKDKGIGIPKKEQINLFEKFFRASNTKDIEGTGLGLNIVKRYVELLHGNIKVSSIENKGTDIFISLPKVHPKKRKISRKTKI